MRSRLVITVALTLLASVSNASQQDKVQLSKELAEALGFEAMLTQLQTQSQQAMEKQMEEMVLQFKQSLPQMPEKFTNELLAGAKEFGQKAASSWDPAEAARIYSEALTSSLSEADMRAAIAIYKTPEGQRQLKAINEAAAKMNAYVIGSMQQSMKEAMPQFIERLKATAMKVKQEQRAARGNNN
jgi:hypothetical protein